MLAVTESKAVEQQQLPVDGSLQLPRDLCVCRINIKQTVFLILVLGVSAALVPIGDFADRNLSLSNYKFHIYFCTYVGVGKSLWWLSMPKDVFRGSHCSQRGFPGDYFAAQLLLGSADLSGRRCCVCCSHICSRARCVLAVV